MQVFYVNIGGGEPTVRPDFWELARLRRRAPRRREVLHQRRPHHAASAPRGWPRTDYVDVQISLDGADRRGQRRGPRARALRTAAARDGEPRATPASRTFKISVVVTRHNVDQLDEFKAIADRYGAQLRLTRLRPSGRGADVWDELHPTAAAAARALRLAAGPRRPGAHRRLVLPPLARSARPLPGLNLCGAGRVVCLIDPVGDVYACPFAIHDEFLAGNVRDAGRLRRGVAAQSELFPTLRSPQTGGACTQCCGSYDACRGGCMAAKFFTGLPLDGPGPRVREGQRRDRAGRRPRAARLLAGPLAHGDGPERAGAAHAARTRPVSACDESPLVSQQ